MFVVFSRFWGRTWKRPTLVVVARLVSMLSHALLLLRATFLFHRGRSSPSQLDVQTLSYSLGSTVGLGYGTLTPNPIRFRLHRLMLEEGKMHS